MSKYVDSFIFPVQKKGLKLYKTIAKKSAAAWIKNGALDYVEAIGEDVPKGKSTSFPRSVKLKGTEVVACGFIVYKSKAHRNQVMKKVMNDQAMMKMWEQIPCDGMRMIFGGFKTIVTK